ncbi:MAG: MBL fold metallo-hydrolase [Deltaproteobacteria bacterium]|nr:MBL fold metallo-hydrolase [Candidatus Deferrimicrobiaceae bacterium]
MIQRITDRIWVVEGGKGGRYPYAHSLYLRDGGGVLFDCGSDLEEILRLKKDGELRIVVMTHYHEDHYSFLHRLPDVEVWASEEDAAALESFDVLLDRYGAAGTEWEAFFRKLLSEKFSYRPRRIARRIVDGERLRFGGTEAIAVIAPGHTPGHLCPLFPSEGVLFLADYDLSGFGPWYGDRPGSIDAFRRSAIRLAEIGAGVHVVSHMTPVHRGAIAPKMAAYLSVIDRREETLRAFLREPRSKREIIDRRIVYGGGHPGPWFDYGEWSLLSKHLEGMLARGEAGREGERYFLQRGGHSST